MAGSGPGPSAIPTSGGVETKNVLHLPAGMPVDIVVTSHDVIHAFWVPRFAGKIDAVPGHVNRLRIQADRPGRYEGRCNEFCGLGHPEMRFVVIVHRPEDFSAALAQAAKHRRQSNERIRRTAAGHAGVAAAPPAHRDLGHRAGAAAPRRGQPFRHRRAHDDHVVRVLRHRRRARHADACAARDAQRSVHGPGDLQPGLHHARVDDVVPVRHPDGGELRGLPDPEDSRHARFRLSPADRVRLLVLPVRQHDPDRVVDRRGRTQRRLVHVHAAELERLYAGHQRRRLAARRDLRRDLGADRWPWRSSSRS